MDLSFSLSPLTGCHNVSNFAQLHCHYYDIRPYHMPITMDHDDQELKSLNSCSKI